MGTVQEKTQGTEVTKGADTKQSCFCTRNCQEQQAREAGGKLARRRMGQSKHQSKRQETPVCLRGWKGRWWEGRDWLLWRWCGASRQELQGQSQRKKASVPGSKGEDTTVSSVAAQEAQVEFGFFPSKNAQRAWIAGASWAWHGASAAYVRTSG